MRGEKREVGEETVAAALRSCADAGTGDPREGDSDRRVLAPPLRGEDSIIDELPPCLGAWVGSPALLLSMRYLLAVGGACSSSLSSSSSSAFFCSASFFSSSSLCCFFSRFSTAFSASNTTCFSPW